MFFCCFFCQAEDGIRDLVRSRGLGDVYKRQGVISGGGHVIVYGMDSLVGWEAGNYQVYVPKSVYRGAGGLFDILNRHGSNALAYLAHPNNTDYNNVLNSTFDVEADTAIVGSPVESGLAFSINKN